tara:strand:- start:2083 stop:3885 length:1803 start_codon:yes stop_codon:yes gene_type:complete
MNNKIIECRNALANEFSSNYTEGQWTTKIQEKIVIEEGDSILVSQSFIDTEASSNQKINIEDDLTLSFSCIKYNMFIRGTPPPSTSYYVPDGLDLDDKIDFDHYFIGTTIGSSVSPHIKKIVTAKSELENASSETGLWGGATIQIKFVAPNDYDASKPVSEQKFTTITKPTAEANFNRGNHPSYTTATSGMGFLYDERGGEPVIISPSAQELRSKYSERIFFNPSVAVDEETIHILEETQTMTLKAGNYAPDEICSAINRALQTNFGLETPANNANVQNVDIIPVTSIFLTETSSYGSRDSRPLVKWDASAVIYPYNPLTPATTQNNLWCGASNIELAWNEAQQVFSWNYLHFPFYYSSAGGGNDAVESVGITIYDKVDGTPVRGLTNKNGGICFTGLHSVNTKTGETTDFFYDQLGFDRNNLCVTYDYVDMPTEAGSIGSVAKVRVEPKDGINTTGGYIGLDSTVKKSNDYFKLPNLANASDSFFSTSQDTVPINAITSAINEVYAFGYYLIEVNSKFLGEFITPDNNYRSIKSIVSRYYEQNSYTSGTQGTIYTHSGNPLYLDSFDIRILQSDKKVASNIGMDNTVFLEIVKGQQKNK